MSRETIECAECGSRAGYFYPAKTYGDPDDCSPAEDTVEIWEGDRAFCSEECLEAWKEDRRESDEEDDDA